MSRVMTVFVNTTPYGDEPDAPPVRCCLALTSGDFGPSSRSAPPAWGQELAWSCDIRCGRKGPVPLTPVHVPVRSAWRRGSGAAVMYIPHTNATSACKGPLCQYSMLPTPLGLRSIERAIILLI